MSLKPFIIYQLKFRHFDQACLAEYTEGRKKYFELFVKIKNKKI